MHTPLLTNLNLLLKAGENEQEGNLQAFCKEHSKEVGNISEKISQYYTDIKEFDKEIIMAGKLHDIGKVCIREEILSKQGKLTRDEFEVIRKHPIYSSKIVKPIDPTGKISEYVLHHHERWDGTGYPDKLKKKEIPLGSRIIAVADVFNALLSKRSYKEAKDINYVIEKILKGKETHFDPEVVEIFYELFCLGRIVV